MWKVNKIIKKKDRKALRIPEDTEPYLKAI